MPEIQHEHFLPTYRSLVNPSVTYDYQTHRVIHLSPLELKNIVALFQTTQLQKPKSAFQMKYRSLLSDVSLKALILSNKVLSLKLAQAGVSEAGLESACVPECKSFKKLPIEIQITIFTYVDDTPSYRNCLYINRHFYQLAKPFLLRSVAFTSTYRFAQFITCLRLHNAIGSFVLDVDLSGLQAGNAEVELAAKEQLQAESSTQSFDEASVYLSRVLAGWRDWKFKNNVYALHPAAIPLSRSRNLPVINQTQNESKRAKLSKYFKRLKSLTNVGAPVTPQTPPSNEAHQTRSIASSSIHPKINKLLLNYAASKDLPVGYILHLIRLCPNLRSLNLANLTLSTDYRVKRAFQCQYPRYDVMNNYHRDMLKIVESIQPQVLMKNPVATKVGAESPRADVASSASAVFSLGTFSKPALKYNSLLPPVNLVSPDLHYANRGDGQLFLSDLSLKSINTSHLEVVLQKEVFTCLQKRQATLRYLNMSSMIWIKMNFVRDYLATIFALDLSEKIVDGKKVIAFREKTFRVGEPRITTDDFEHRSMKAAMDGVVLDFTNSGMSKNLPWAQVINSEERPGEQLIYRIMNDELVTVQDENIIRERNRRGRVGENYFSASDN